MQNAISTHTSRVGCDGAIRGAIKGITFLLTHPVWDVTAKGATLANTNVFLLTHPVWDVTTNLVLETRNGYFYSHIPCGM